MATTPTIDYFSRDFDSLRSDMLKLIPYFTPEWTDRNPDDLGVVMVELLSYMGDIVHFYIDRRAQDLYLGPAFTRLSVVNLLKLIDYTVMGKQAATADEVFTITDDPLDEAVIIPRATKLQAPAGTGGDPVQFETLADYVFAYTVLTANAAAPAQQISVSSSSLFKVGQTVNLRDNTTLAGESLVISEIPDSSTIKFSSQVQGSYTTAQSARVSVMSAPISIQEGSTIDESLSPPSQGVPWQIWRIPRLSVISGSVSIYVQETTLYELWTEIESLGIAEPDEKVYELSTDFEGYVSVRTGDGMQGKIPITNADIRAIYRIGGGVTGNVGANKITKLLDPISGSGGPINFSVTNPVQASGGSEEQSAAEAKLLGPKSLRAMSRCVTLEDFETIAKNVSGVREASAIVKGSPLFREFDVFIVPYGGYVPSQTLIDQVEGYLQARSMAGSTVYVQGPINVVGIRLAAVVTVMDGYSASEVQILVENAINEFFDVSAEGARFGKDVNMSDLMYLIDGITGVDHVDFSQLTLDPSTTWIWELSPDSPAVIDYIVGQNTLSLVDQEYTVSFSGPTTYVVRNAAGTTVGTGTLGSELVTSDGAIKMKLSAGVDAMSAGDRSRFRVSQYVGNVEIEEYEIRRLDTMTLSFLGGA